MKAVVIRLAQVIDKIQGPGTAETPRRIEPGIEAQHLARANLQQGTVGLQGFEFGFVFDTRQIEAVDLGILDEQRFVRRPEHRVPAQPTKMSVMVLRQRVMDGEGGARKAPANQGCKEGCRELELNETSHEVGPICSEALASNSPSQAVVGASSGYSKPSCQAIKPDTASTPLRGYLKCTSPVVTTTQVTAVTAPECRPAAHLSSSRL